MLVFVLKSVTLANTQRLKDGKGTVGFINPSIYAADSALFNDIVSGNNACCSSGKGCCQSGFKAGPGWDPASGRGSINFKNFLTIASSVPNFHPTPAPGKGRFIIMNIRLN